MTVYLQPSLPWSGSAEEERRYRRILAFTMTVFLTLSLIVPRVVVPPVEIPDVAMLPARLARIIADPVTLGGRQVPAPAPAAEKQPADAAKAAVATTDAVATEDRVVVSTSAATKPALVARKDTEASRSLTGAEGSNLESLPPAVRSQLEGPAAKTDSVASIGVLALSGSLSELAEMAPTIASANVQNRRLQGLSEGRQSAAERGLASADRLAAGVTRGSGGVGVMAPSSEALLALQGYRPASSVGTGTGPVAGSGSPSIGPVKGDEFNQVRSEAEIQEVLNRNKRAIYLIYNSELRKDPRLRGKVVVSITISPTGEVTGSRITYTELNAETLEKKLLLLIKRIDFGSKPGVPTVTTKVPIEFFPV